MSPAELAFDAALAAWLTRQAAAEERLTSFAFREGQAPVDLPAPSSQVELRRWVLGVVVAPGIAAFLHALGDSGRPIADLADDGALGLRPGDRVSLAARIGVPAAGGLVVRELEADRVSLTELGRAALELAAEPAMPSAVAGTT